MDSVLDRVVSTNNEIIDVETDNSDESEIEISDVTEEMEDMADNMRNEAVIKFENGDFNDAIDLYCKAIKCNPHSGLYYQERARCYLMLKLPIQAIKDCNKSLDINPNSSFSYDWRGLSYKLLGKFEQAFKDLIASLELDYDESIYKEMMDIEPKAKKMREHRRRYEDKVLNDKVDSIKKTRLNTENNKVLQSELRQCNSFSTDTLEEIQTSKSLRISQIKVDLLLADELKDSDVQAAIKEIESGQATIESFQDNKKIFDVLTRLKLFMEQS